MKKIYKTRILNSLYYLVFFVLGIIMISSDGVHGFRAGRFLGALISVASLIVIVAIIISINAYKNFGGMHAVLPALKEALLSFLSFELFKQNNKSKKKPKKNY